ncbi:MAG: CPBP family intramembrane metalloprotease [Spirochaetales bacterium]|nr:CPBP family intramembrane metalloprotease [Spirochaetales bacterium]
MKKSTLKKICYPAGLLIMALALIPANLPFMYYLKALAKRGAQDALSDFYATSDISALPLSLGGRFFYTFSPFVLLLGLLFILWKVLHGKSPLSLLSGSSRFRLNLFFRGFSLWLVLAFAAEIILFIFTRENYQVTFDPVGWLKLFLWGVLFIVPQVTLEETFFRGYLIKGGTLITGKPLIPLILFSVVFGLLHSANPEVGRYGALLMMPQYIGMGLFLSYLSWKSNGLELALGIHLANNGWGFLVVNSGGTAFPTPAPLSMENWNPYLSLIFLSLSMGIFLILIHKGPFSLEEKERNFYRDN